jgi:hypothetical protein
MARRQINTAALLVVSDRVNSSQLTARRTRPNKSTPHAGRRSPSAPGRAADTLRVHIGVPTVIGQCCECREEHGV